jgi:hypothetical protein
MNFHQYLDEEYITTAKGRNGDQEYPIYKNPSSSDLKALRLLDVPDPTYVRFLLTTTDMYVSSFFLLHPYMIAKLQLRHKVLFRGTGKIKQNKIEIDELRANRNQFPNIDNLQDSNYLWKTNFINWDIKQARWDASVL